MKLWEYLRKKLIEFSDRIAFPQAGIKYADILRLESENEGFELKICDGMTRTDQALSILKGIAEGKTVIPVSRDYGEKRYCEIIDAANGIRVLDNDVAFVMFTSGTTGKPKGVMLTDENIITNLEYISTYFDIGGLKSICIARPLSHISVLTGELLYALCSGIKVYFYEETFMPIRLLKYISDNCIDVLCATPTMFLAMAKCKNAKISALKVGVISGEILTGTAAKAISAAFDKTDFYNVYGLTEHSPRVSALLPKDFLIKAGSIGKAIGNVQIEIKGGELAVKSPCVMKGYIGEKRETEAKIKGGWLYTGDIAHTDGDGYYYIDGRKDDMIIRGGVNIFPSEIESVLALNPKIKDCAAYGVQDELYGQKICVKYTGDAEEREVRSYFAKFLPPHLFPQKVEKTDAINLTDSGKKARQ